MSMTPEHIARCAEAKRRMAFHGINVGQWARDHGFPPSAVYDILNCRASGQRGIAHNIAVALGIKEGAPNTNAGAGVPRVAGGEA